MDIMSQTLKECMADEDKDQVNTQPTDTPVEDKPVEEPKPADDPKPEEDQPEDKPDDKPEDTPSDDKPKQPKDTSQFTKEEKAEFAFKRQLAKQRERHAQEIEDIKNTFQKQFDDFKATMTKKDPEPVKTRADFPLEEGGDDAYIKYLVKQGMDEERAAMKAEQDKSDQERAEREREQAEASERQRMVAETFQANCRDAIDPDDMADFQSKVQLASSNGLAELLDKAPAVRDYIFTCKRGPKLLHAMLRDRDTFASVMRTAAVSVNPMMTTIELDSMASSLPAKYSQPDPEPEQQRTMPHLGKPGAGGPSGNDSKDITNDDAELIKFMRSRR